MANIIVSIIIPVYNSEKYLRTCIDSILIQPFKEFEIILVNDGSKDTSGDICDLYALKDKRIQVYHQNNGGVSHARNSGLAKAKGEWVYFVDSDDSIQPGTFDIFFTNSKLSDVDIVQFGYRRILSHKIIEYSPLEEKLFNNIDDYHANSSFHTFNLWIHFIKRSIIIKNKVQFSRHICYAEDLEFTIKCYLLSTKVLTLNSKNYNYHKHEGSATSKKVNMSTVFDHVIVLENLLEFIKSNNEVNGSSDFIEKRLVHFVKTYLVRTSMHSEWYYNLKTYQRGYNQIFSLTKNRLGFKLNRAYLFLNRITIVPCILYLIVRVNIYRKQQAMSK